MADDFIKRDELIKEISSITITMNIGRMDCKTLLESAIKSYCKAVLNKVKELPAIDVEEVVRCKDCKYFYPFEYIEQQGMCEHRSGLNGTDYCVSEDDFCSYGERKDENVNCI